ncbi:MAG: GPR endopeptidase [Defluviitaleaceae bacterium]|nr:GPR endopeptidase [Defluviitaleaceae bacterium]
MKKYGYIYTDLAAELRDIVIEEEVSTFLEGIESEEYEVHGIKVHWVKVTNSAGEELIGKPIGNYITIESPDLREGDIDAHENAIKVMVEILGKIHNLDKDSTALIIGLGNQHVSPDALGPKVVSKLLITRHIKETLPDALCDNTRSVAALSPGVMGITGIETLETVKGLVERVKPDLLIAVDALASRSVGRINATIQIADTGISPGAGLGNKRKSLNEESLGVKVISIGVPTVVDAATLASDTIERIIDEMVAASDIGTPFYTMLQALSAEEKYAMIKDILQPYSENMFVTPKNVDAVIDRLSNVIANSLNISLHPGLGREDINRYIY